MDKVFGKEDQDKLINIKAYIKMTKNGGMEYLHGQMVMCTREVILAI
jgi:hypothetical protein